MPAPAFGDGHILIHKTPASTYNCQSFGRATDDNNSSALPSHPPLLQPPLPVIKHTTMGGETFESEKPKGTYPKISPHPVGQWIPNIYKDRIASFYGGGQYEKKNLRA